MSGAAPCSSHLQEEFLAHPGKIESKLAMFKVYLFRLDHCGYEGAELEDKAVILGHELWVVTKRVRFCIQEAR